MLQLSEQCLAPELAWLPQRQGDDRGVPEVAAKPLGATIGHYSGGGYGGYVLLFFNCFSWCRN